MKNITKNSEKTHVQQIISFLLIAIFIFIFVDLEFKGQKKIDEQIVFENAIKKVCPTFNKGKDENSYSCRMINKVGLSYSFPIKCVKELDQNWVCNIVFP